MLDSHGGLYTWEQRFVRPTLIQHTMKDILGESILTVKGSGPGKSFREGISLVKLFEMFPNDQATEKWFEGGIHKPFIRIRRHCGHSGAAAHRQPAYTQ